MVFKYLIYLFKCSNENCMRNLMLIDAKMQNEQKWRFWCYFWCSVYDAIFFRFYSWLLICILNMTFFEISFFLRWIRAVLDLLCILGFYQEGHRVDWLALKGLWMRSTKLELQLWTSWNIYPPIRVKNSKIP